MLESTDTLLTIAEIAVAFAGFAGIASVLARSHPSIDPRVNALRLHNMVDIGLGIVVLALAPILLADFLSARGATPETFWRATAAFGFVYAGAMYYRVNARSAPVQKLIGYDLPGQNRLKALAISGLACVAVVGVMPHLAVAYALYLLGVGFALTACGILFLRILNSLLVIELEPSPEEEAASTREE